MSELPGAPKSLWLAGERAAEPRPALEGESVADVAIVGGGIVGASAALMLAERGLDVALVEARTIASGVTGNSTAKVTALHETTYSQISSKVGREAAAAYAAANDEGLRLVAATTERHGIECSLETAPNYLYTEDPGSVATVERECEAAARAGLEVELTRDTGLPYDVLAAIRLGGQIAIDSAAYTRGVAAAAESAGARIYERSRVRSIAHRHPCRLELENGACLKAEQVVLATHMPLLDRGLYFARLRPQASYAVAAPSADAPAGMYLGIGERTRSIRSAPARDGKRYVIVGGEGHKVGQSDGAESYAKLARWARDRFGVAGIEYRWSAHDLMSPDELPMVGKLAPWAPRILTATGFSKWGLAMGSAAAAMLCGELVGEPDPKREVFEPARINPRAQAPEIVKENANVAMRFVGDRLHRSGDGELQAGEGRVVGEGRRQIAECRDAEGKLHRLSARCTHLGCIVRWNSGDHTWDCPCHGSRFAADGSVRNGPASAPLAPES